MRCARTSGLVDAGNVVGITTRHLSTMRATESSGDPRASGDATGRCAIGDKWFAGWVLLALIRASDATAGEEVNLAGPSLRPDFGTPRQDALTLPWLPLPASYGAATLPEPPVYSAHDFRPRGRSIFESDPTSNGSERQGEATPLQGNGTVWQRLSEFRAHNRVRVLTLWEGGGNSVSLQAGRKGDPSVQWTSRLMNRGGATRGLLDRVFSASLEGAGRGLHLVPRGNAADTAGRPAKLGESGAGK